jgi:hypothetical protein
MKLPEVLHHRAAAALAAMPIGPKRIASPKANSVEPARTNMLIAAVALASPIAIKNAATGPVSPFTSLPATRDEKPRG